MPKELVYSSEALGANPAGARVEHVAVGWARDRGVQLGMIEGPPVTITIDGKPADDPGLWMDLDREQINQLIRSLRKARDAAFGRDE